MCSQEEISAVISTKNELIVVQQTEIIPEEKFKYIEFVTSEFIKFPEKTLIVSDAPTIYRQTLPTDGLFYYNRFKLYTKEAAEEAGCLDSAFYIDEHPIDSEYPKFYFDGEEITLQEIFDEQYRTKGDDDIIYPIFSICKISLCLEKKQRKLIFSKNSCKQTDYDLDYLFTTVSLLRWLIGQKRYEEASDILNFVNSCAGICDCNKVSPCNCNK